HSAQAEFLYLARLRDGIVHGPQRDLADAEQALRPRRAKLSQPQVVGVHAGLAVVVVEVFAEHHPDARIQDFGGDAVAVLVGKARRRIPSAALEPAAVALLELRDIDR